MSSDQPLADGSVFTSRMQLTYPMDARSNLGLVLRFEDAPANDSFTTIIGYNRRI